MRSRKICDPIFQLEISDKDVNDPEFSGRVAQKLLELLKK